PTRRPRVSSTASVRLSSFFMIPPPPTSTLFPYTTLFRSRRDKASGRANMIEVTRKEGRTRGTGGMREELVIQARSPYGGMFAHADRKSTRLNSSHLGISYAVFCLKKKKHTLPSSYDGLGR